MDGMLLMLVHPAGQGNDEKGQRIQQRAHSCRLPRHTFLMISIELSFYTARRVGSTRLFYESESTSFGIRSSMFNRISANRHSHVQAAFAISFAPIGLSLGMPMFVGS